ncbi:MAG: LytTR family transcriptional regulator [Gammaproteobacteria bacterium]|nr:LytTR family transcriptional regulator [Gammaproteobacteria bacterium]
MSVPTLPASASDSYDLLRRYLARRAIYERIVVVLIYLGSAVSNAIIVNIDVSRSGLGDRIAPWEPWVWELSSNLVLLALLPLVLAVNARHPLVWGRLRRSLGAHLIVTLPYCLIHVCAMVALRHAAYRVAGAHYDFGNWGRGLFYEYLKDARSYFSVLAAIYFYQLMLLRLQGEARLLAAPEVGAPAEAVERPQRFLVRKFGKEFLVAVADVEWIEASGNYVNLYVSGRHYPLRATMASIEDRLDPQRFVRVHRSYIVNLAQVASIEPLDTGDARLFLLDGTQLPCSRRYRAALRASAAV